MKVKIGQLATVQMGYSFRSRLEVSRDGGVAVIQMKDLLHDNTVACGSLANVDMGEVKDHHLVQKGDLIFRSRGQVTTAALLLENLGRAVVAAPLLRIRITTPGKILPEYLNWYISQRDAQRYFTSRQGGTSVNMVSRKQLEEMPVEVPPLEQQKNIVELASLAAREQTLLNKMTKKREQYFGAVLMQIAKGK